MILCQAITSLLVKKQAHNINTGGKDNVLRTAQQRNERGLCGTSHAGLFEKHLLLTKAGFTVPCEAVGIPLWSLKPASLCVMGGSKLALQSSQSSHINRMEY